MKDTENLFKSKAKNILKSSPQSMKEFLEHSSENQYEKGDAQIHNGAKPQMLNPPAEDESPQSIVRLHVHIRQDLANKLLELVFQRKKIRDSTKKEASQRAIIEEALEMYFKTDSHISIK